MGCQGKEHRGSGSPSTNATHPGASPMDVGRCWLTRERPRDLGTVWWAADASGTRGFQLEVSRPLGVGGLLVGEATNIR